jgi:arylsulfatase A-like enzyme
MRDMTHAASLPAVTRVGLAVAMAVGLLFVGAGHGRGRAAEAAPGDRHLAEARRPAGATRSPQAVALPRDRGGPTPRRPNVLFLFSDDQRADAIGAWGNAHLTTPNLDRLVNRGTSFTRAYIMGAFQGAVCAPSRAMLMTSLSLFQVKEDLAGQTTWPERFGGAGYRTFLSGKWHNGEASAVRVFDIGRTVFFGGMAAPYDLPVKDFTRGESGFVARTADKHDAEAFADAAIAFLRERRDGQPFLAYVAFKAPHDPRVAPARWHQRYAGRLPPVPANFLPQHPFDNGEMTIRDEQLLPWPRTEAMVRRELADYYASIGFLDEQVGRVLEGLRRSGLERDTLVVFASDNGLAIGSHGLMGKQNLYEHSVRVPLVIAGPGVPEGRRTDALCYLQDVFPTLADLAGVAPLDGVYGRSLRALFGDSQARFRAAIFTAYRDIQRAIRDERFKLIRYPLVDRTQLFDLVTDPFEREDQAVRADHAATVARMRGLLDEARAGLGDTAPLEVPSPASGDWTPPVRRPHPAEPGAAVRR